MFKRLRAFFHQDAIHSEIADELQFHIDLKAADLERNGMPADQALIAARKSFGSTGRIHEQGFDERGAGLLDDLWGDVRFAFRLLRKQWMKTSVLVVTLALGVGVNTAVFGVVSSVLLHPLPFRGSTSLVVLHQANHGKAGGVSYPHFKDWLSASHSFESMAVYSAESATLTGEGDATIVFGAVASSSLFHVLGVEPSRGRLFRAEDDQFAGTKAAAPILISDRLWHSRFGDREEILGQLIHLDGRLFEIVGVIPGRLAFPLQKDQVDYWKTVGVDADPALYGGSIPKSRGYPRYDGVVARLRDGVTLAAARQEMAVLAARIAHDHPKTTSANEIAITPELEEVVGASSRTMILILYGAVFCVLLVACLNVANVLLVDALGRRREFSLRLALGAPAVKLIRQLLVESLLVAIAGGLAGLSVSWLVLKLFLAFAPEETPRLSDIQLGGEIFFYVIAVSLAGGLLFGALPALSAMRLESGRSVTQRSSPLQPGSLLICGQIILGMILTCCAVILVKNFQQIIQSGRGFNPHRVLTASLSLPVAKYGQSSPAVTAYYKSLLEAAKSLPEVESAAIAEVLPLSGQSNGTTVSIVGIPDSSLPSTGLRFVESSYFKTLQIPLLGGRAFNETDTLQRPACAIVNQAFVRRFLPGSDPYRNKIQLGWGGEKPKQIVGVVADISQSAASPVTEPEVYVPVTQFPLNDMSIVLRTSGNPYNLVKPLRDMTRRLDAGVPLDRIRSLDDYLLLTSAQQQFLMWILVAFAGMTMLLSVIGLYGVLSDAVLARSREFGIRLALGSPVRRVAYLVLGHGMGVTLAGVVAGSVASLFAAGLLQHWLYEAGGQHTGAIAISGGITLAVALIACAFPAHKAASVDPASLLRIE